MYAIDLNSDLGESFGAYTLGMDEEVLKYITSANVACGFHAGDPVIMEKTTAMAKKYGTAVGAHPGFPDLAGFGRRNMKVTPAEAKAYIQYQVGALQGFSELQHVKPHGAFYNMSAVDEELAIAICEGVKAVNPELILLGLAGSKHLTAAKKVGIRCASEVFADRGYQDDGTLVSRSKPGAMIHDRKIAIARTVRMVKEGCVETVSGKVIPIMADSICVHGDNPDAIGFVQEIRAALEAEGVKIAPIADVLASAREAGK